jgi:Na+/proline symporter
MSEEIAMAGKRTLGGMSPAIAQRLEWALIGLGILALALIFQPFSLALFGVGCALVVFAGLANNLLPLCQPGTSVIVALAFFVIMLISITAAYLYGVFFVTAVAPDTSEPFYRQPFVWGVAALAVAFAALLTSLLRR